MLKRLLRRWKRLLLIAFLLLVGLFCGGLWWLQRSLEPARLVRTLEARFNARVQVESTTASFFGSPASFSLKGLMAVPRDEVANQGAPLSARSKLDGIKAVGLNVDNLQVKFSLWEALLGKIHILDLGVSGLRQNTEQSEAGVDGFTEMLKSPSIVNGKPKAANPRATTATNQLDVSGLPPDILIDHLALDRLRYDSRSLKSRRTITLQNASVKLDGAHFQGTRLAPGSQPQALIDGNFFVLGKKKVEQMNIPLSVTSGALKLSPQGDVLELPCSVVIKKGTKLTDLPALQRMNEKMKKWEKYHLKLQPLPESAEVLEDARLELVFNPENVVTGNDLKLKLDNYEVTLKKGAKFFLKDDTCEMDVVISGNEAISRSIVEDFQNTVKHHLGDLGADLGKGVIDTFKKQNMIEANGRLSIPMGIKGPLAKPEVEDKVTGILKDALFSSILPGVGGADKPVQ